MRKALILVLLASGAFCGSAWATGLSSDREAQTAREGARRGLSLSYAEMRAELDPGLRLGILSAAHGQEQILAEQLDAARAMLDAVALQAEQKGTEILDEAGAELERVPVHIGTVPARLVRK